MKKRRILLVYLVYFVLCAGMTVRYAGQTAENYRADVYGVETDDTLELTEHMAVSVIFSLSEQYLEGVQLKFQMDDPPKGELVRAVLTDVETGKVLASDTARLQYELVRKRDVGSSIYFSLPVTQRQGDEVCLSFTLEGEGILASPSLILSDSCAHDAKLVVMEGENQRPVKGNLVFSARYRMGVTSNRWKALLQGLLWMLIGGAVASWAWVRTDKEQQERARRCCDGWRDRLSAFLRRHRRGVVLVVLLLFATALYVLVYQYGLEAFLRKHREADFLLPMYGILCALLTVFVVVLYVLCYVRRTNMERLFVVFAAGIGLIFTLVFGLYTIPDEPSHIDTAYCLSNEILGVPESEKPGYIYKRADDVDPMAEQKIVLGADTYERLWTQLFSKVQNETLVECAALNNFSNAGRLFYVPQALGISAGRLCRLGTLPTYLLGRLFALAAYVFLTYWGIRKLPFGKLSMLLLGILPITLQEAASFSYDSTITGAAFLYLGYVFFLVYGDVRDIRVRDVAVVAVTGCLMATVKGSVYLPLCLLPLLRLVVHRQDSRRQKAFMIGLTILFFCAFLSGGFASTLARLSQVSGEVVGGSYAQQLYTFDYFLKHPHRLIGIYANSLLTSTDSYLRSLLGGSLSWLDVKIKWYVLIAFLMLLLLSCVNCETERSLTWPERAWMGVLAFGSFLLVELSMLLSWTPKDSNYIQGVQGRYFLPFFPLVLLTLRNTFFKIRNNIDHTLIFSAGVLQVITVLLAVKQVFE